MQFIPAISHENNLLATSFQSRPCPTFRPRPNERLFTDHMCTVYLGFCLISTVINFISD